ncbi:MAG: hypothetical protein JO193_05365 [Candidatus Eremiobacteraeota bacterium]|nr:hypothetical protein [Candidatus Eremiobacteraeota bacterium]MBV9972382.1 hypothetical protein [Candidatus Eremiobacteraeota bacterium]
MTTRLFLLIAFVSAIVLYSNATNAAKADAPSAASAPYAYVTKVPQAAANDPAAPQIYEVDLNAQQLSAPGPLAVRILTSSNVNAVYVHVEGQTFGIPLTQSGQFQLAVTLPTLPSYMKGRNYQFDFEALTTDGKRTHVDVPVFITL